MAFLFSERYIDEYYAHGYTVFRCILPPSLIGDLRRVTDRARILARAKHGPQTQRLQPVFSFDLDTQPFEDFRDLPELRDAIGRVLSPQHTHGTREYLGVFLEPADLPYCTPWHRDWRNNVGGLALPRWDAVFTDVQYFNQLNCALYDDGCTWVVPGSHLRPDLPRETARFPAPSTPQPELEGKTAEERERLCLEYAARMPGATRMHLNAGDFALYRSTLWHLGNYVPYCKRATLHDAVDTPAYVAWREETNREKARHREARAAAAKAQGEKDENS